LRYFKRKKTETMQNVTTTSHPEPIPAERLELRLMTPAFLEASINGDQAQATQLLDATIPAEWWEERGLITRRLEQVHHDPSYQPWLPRAIVLRPQPMMIGHINFHTAPDPEYLRALAPGGIEFGYTIFPQFRRQGYATEACLALITWARQQQVMRFVLSISPANEPSLRIATRLGFAKIGSQMDEEDGLEEICERRFITSAG
jgi:[ribosomal protein S5]-alanine N-acetyltransferase